MCLFSKLQISAMCVVKREVWGQRGNEAHSSSSSFFWKLYDSFQTSINLEEKTERTAPWFYSPVKHQTLLLSSVTAGEAPWSTLPF